MTPVFRPFATALVAGSIAVAGAAAQNPPQTAAAQSETTQKPVAIIGCVERALPSADDPTQGTQPDRMYKLIDTQPGGGSPVMDRTGRVVSTPPAEAPPVVDPQYWLTGAATMDFANYQNQRVEIIGTLSRIEKPVTAQQTTPPQQAPKSVLTAANVRVISTECKG